MRTTISIQDQLFEVAKSRAHERKCSLGQVIEEALRQSLIAKAPETTSEVSPFVTFTGKGVKPGIHLQDSSTLLDAMESE